MTKARIKKHPILSTDKNSDSINFTFNNKKLTAKPGEMIATALFAHGIHEFGRHKKDDSPQGIFCANGQCSQCMFTMSSHSGGISTSYPISINIFLAVILPENMAADASAIISASPAA